MMKRIPSSYILLHLFLCPIPEFSGDTSSPFFLALARRGNILSWRADMAPGRNFYSISGFKDDNLGVWNLTESTIVCCSNVRRKSGIELGIGAIDGLCEDLADEEVLPAWKVLVEICLEVSWVCRLGRHVRYCLARRRADVCTHHTDDALASKMSRKLRRMKDITRLTHTILMPRSLILLII